MNIRGGKRYKMGTDIISEASVLMVRLCPSTSSGLVPSKVEGRSQLGISTERSRSTNLAVFLPAGRYLVPICVKLSEYSLVDRALWHFQKL